MYCNYSEEGIYTFNWFVTVRKAREELLEAVGLGVTEREKIKKRKTKLGIVDENKAKKVLSLNEVIEKQMKK